MMKTRRILLFAIVMMIFTLTSCGKIKIEKSSAEYAGMYYQEVYDELSGLKFENISTEEIADLPSLGTVKEGTVETVTASGETFDAGSSFAKDAEILITYHTIKTIPLPIGQDEIGSMDFNEIGKMLSDSGFTNVELTEVYDLAPDTAEADHVNEMKVSGAADFKKGDAVPFDSAIVVVCHYPLLEKYNVKVKVEFTDNGFFGSNKYGVVFSIDGKSVATLGHGVCCEKEMELEEGVHELSFNKINDPSINGKTELEITCNTEAVFSIKAETSEITVDVGYIYRESDVGENQIRIAWNRDSFKIRDYKDVVSELQSAGFTNIKYQPIYDAVPGIIREYVKDVLIDGSNEYQIGDIFDKDVEIIIIHHANEEDDPARKGDEKTDEPAEADDNSENVAPEKETTFNSTNDAETAKLGNCGKFAYVNRLSNYDIFYVIDFDEGLVYNFLYGQGDKSGTAYIIESGDLNSGLYAKYDTDGDENDYTVILHFHYANNPDVLIEDMSEYGYGESKFQAASIEDALKLKENYEFNQY